MHAQHVSYKSICKFDLFLDNTTTTTPHQYITKKIPVPTKESN
uniref:Uncharacterized protein n=1 Tax=Oryza rufipogon TaxID=4529 RepID=A0A0E0N9X3_ORYRU